MHVDAAGRGLPPVPAGLWLGDVPAGRLFHLVAGATAGARVTRARFPTLVIRHCVLKVRLSRMPVAWWKRTRAISDLDKMPEPVARLVAVCLVSVVTFEDRYRVQAHGELAPARQYERPGAEAVWGSGSAARGERPGAVVTSQAGGAGERGGGDRQVQPSGECDRGCCRADLA